MTWEQVWPGICYWFGLKGVRPDPSKKTGVERVQERNGQWGRWVKENRLKDGALEATSWDFMSAVMRAIRFDRQYDLNACREVGFQEKTETAKGYIRAFERMRVVEIYHRDEKFAWLACNIQSRESLDWMILSFASLLRRSHLSHPV